MTTHPPKHPKVELVNLTKEYDNGDVVAVDDVSLDIHAGETIALLGSSGCGKSTTLNMIVGLESPTSGDIQIDGKSVVSTPAGKRDVGLVFQDYAVFTSMTVRKNLAFGLQVRNRPKMEIDKAVDEVAELLSMRDKLDAKAKDLGGSELQRVAIGRTLVTKPSVLLLDEPLSNLETAARLAMRRELRRLQGEIGLTIIYVTHDQVEALSLANRIAVMNAGKILQVEEATIITQQPDHIFVAGFLGSPSMNLYRGKFLAEDGLTLFCKNDLAIPVDDVLPDDAAPVDTMYTMGVRPENVRLVRADESRVNGVVNLVEPRGPEVVLTLDVGVETMKVVAPAVEYPEVGTTVGVVIAPEGFAFFDGDTNRRITFSPELQGSAA